MNSKSSKLFFLLMFFAFTTQISFAQGFSYRDFFNSFSSNFHSLQVIMSMINFGGTYSGNTYVGFNKNKQVQTQPQPTDQSTGDNSDTTSDQNTDSNTFLDNTDDTSNNDTKDLSKDDAKKIDKQISSLITSGQTSSSVTPDTTCSSANVTDVATCKKGLFQGCAESFYNKTEMAPECKSFPAQDYQNYVNAKNQILGNPTQNPPQAAQTSLGPVTPSTYVPSPNTTQNSAINGQPYTPTPQQQSQFSAGQQDQFPNNPIPANKTNEATNSKAPVQPGKEGWIQGWGTVYCNGKDACNSKTAMGMDPKSRLISLPYKTIDALFGTKTDCLVKKTCSGNLASEYAKVRGRAIEVEMIKNGKKGIFPLGDVGPAEWTGNAIDFTVPTCQELGCGGKDQVRFRATPQSGS